MKRKKQYIKEALQIIASLGLTREQQNERSALAFWPFWEWLQESNGVRLKTRLWKLHQ